MPSTPDSRGYSGLFDPDELRDYANDLNAMRNNATLPRGFHLAPRSRRILIHDDPTLPGGLDLQPDDEDDYPEPPPPRIL